MHLDPDRRGEPSALDNGFFKSHAINNGFKTLRDHGTFIVGISLGNGYFTEASLKRITQFIRDSGCGGMFMVTDGPAKHNFSALNYSERSSIRSAAQQGMKLRSLCIQSGARSNELVDWSLVYGHPEFKESLIELTALFKDNDEFGREVLQSAETYIASRSDHAVSNEQCLEASNYLLEELSFLLSAKKIFNLESVSYLYHRSWPIFERLVNGEFDSKRRDLGFFCLE